MKYRHLKRMQATRLDYLISRGSVLCGCLILGFVLSSNQAFALPGVDYSSDHKLIISITADYDRNLKKLAKKKQAHKKKGKHKKRHYAKNAKRAFSQKEMRFLKRWLGKKGVTRRRNRIYINNCLSQSRQAINRRLQDCSSEAVRVAAVRRPIQHYYDVYGLGLGLGLDLGLDPYKNRSRTRKQADFPPPQNVIGKVRSKKTSNKNKVFHIKKKWVR